MKKSDFPVLHPEEKVKNLFAHLKIACLGVIHFSQVQNSIEHILKELFLL